MRFATGDKVPVWLAVVYLGSNIVLNTLNFYWFGKMIETVRSRFRDPNKAAGGGVGGGGKASGGEVEVGLEGMDGGTVVLEVIGGESTDDGGVVPAPPVAAAAADGGGDDDAEWEITQHASDGALSQSFTDANGQKPTIVVAKTQIRKRKG